MKHDDDFCVFYKNYYVVNIPMNIKYKFKSAGTYQN